MRIGLGILMILHGLIHLAGFVKAFNLTELKELTLDVSRPMGLLWLAAAMLFAASATTLLIGKNWWWPIAAVSLVVSQVLIIMFWQDAKFGTIANILILAGLILVLTGVLS